MKYAPKVHASKYDCNQAQTMIHTQRAARNDQARTMKATEPYHAIFRSFSGEKRWLCFMSVRVRLTTQSGLRTARHRRSDQPSQYPAITTGARRIVANNCPILGLRCAGDLMWKDCHGSGRNDLNQCPVTRPGSGERCNKK